MGDDADTGMSELSIKLENYLERLVPTMGMHILQRQCEILHIDPDNIQKKDLLRLSDMLAKAVEMFVGYDESRMIRLNILQNKF